MSVAELSVPISRARPEAYNGTGIVGALTCVADTASDRLALGTVPAGHARQVAVCKRYGVRQEGLTNYSLSNLTAIGDLIQTVPGGKLPV